MLKKRLINQLNNNNNNDNKTTKRKKLRIKTIYLSISLNKKFSRQIILELIYRY